MERAKRQYSPELKQRIVDEVEAGRLSIREAARDTQATVPMVQKWLAEYGRYRPKRDIVEVVMKSEQERIAALEKALAEAHLQLHVYDELLTQADKKYQLDLKKRLVRDCPGLLRPPHSPPRSGRLRRPRRHPRRVLQTAPATAPRRRAAAESRSAGGGGP